MSRERDKILEQALKHELRGTAGPVTPDCLDAETLAAWEDGGLDAKAMESATLHASTCARCQALLGVMSRGVPAALPAQKPGRFRLWSWWLAPIAAATAAVTLWIVVPNQQQIATAPPAPSVAQDKAQPEPPAQPALEENRGESAARAQARDRQDLSATANKTDAGKLKDEATVAPAAAAEAVAAPTPPAAAAPPALLQKRLAFSPIEIVSPNSTRRWRIVPAGVEFSVDQGASWVPVRANPAETLTDGVSPSGTICWLIGKDGVVLVTADGSTFAKVDLPVRIDVASIVASDARSASVTTVDGRTFSTNDSGRTWREN